MKILSKVSKLKKTKQNKNYEWYESMELGSEYTSLIRTD